MSQLLYLSPQGVAAQKTVCSDRNSGSTMAVGFEIVNLVQQPTIRHAGLSLEQVLLAVVALF